MLIQDVGSDEEVALPSFLHCSKWYGSTEPLTDSVILDISPICASGSPQRRTCESVTRMRWSSVEPALPPVESKKMGASLSSSAEPGARTGIAAIDSANCFTFEGTTPSHCPHRTQAQSSRLHLRNCLTARPSKLARAQAQSLVSLYFGISFKFQVVVIMMALVVKNLKRFRFP